MPTWPGNMAAPRAGSVCIWVRVRVRVRARARVRVRVRGRVSLACSVLHGALTTLLMAGPTRSGARAGWLG